MKVAAAQTSQVLGDTAKFVGLLIYGEDWGLVRSRSQLAIRSVLGAERSPFRLATLVKEEHARLRDEAGSLALGGGRRVVHVQDGADGLAPALEKLTVRPADVLIVIEAGDLPARSKLRGFCEKSAFWAAIACYEANAASVGAEIRSTLGAAGLSVEPDALAYLATELTGESFTRASELEKLALYASGGAGVDLEAARLCCAGSLEATLSDAVAAAIAGQPERVDALLAELTREGATGPGLLAVLSGQLQRMLKARLHIDRGETAEAAMRTIMPPMYPRQASAFLRDLQLWSTSGLEAALSALRAADIACKRAASPDLAITGRLLASIAERAASRARSSGRGAQ